MSILQYIPTGRENAVSRKALVGLTYRTARANRKEIERLWVGGFPVISASDENDCWLAGSVDEFDRFLREADRRSSAQRYPRLRQIVAEANGERIVPVRAHLRHLKSQNVEGQVTL